MSRPKKTDSLKVMYTVYFSEEEALRLKKKLVEQSANQYIRSVVLGSLGEGKKIILPPTPPPPTIQPVLPKKIEKKAEKVVSRPYDAYFKKKEAARVEAQEEYREQRCPECDGKPAFTDDTRYCRDCHVAY